MDKSAIKSFAIEARKILMKSAITQAGFYGVSKDGCSQPTQKGAGFEVYRTIAGTDNRIFGDDIKRREKLVKAVEEKGFDQVIEETAYTWFNRLIAIRFMEVNGYLPTRTRVLSSETGSNTPDLMSQYMDVDLDMTMDELEKVQTFVSENRYDDAFALLFVKQCNALNEILPELFERTTDYMELLLKLSYTSDGVVRMLVDMIPESNFDIEQEGQIEIIGWMYQYYNTELKDDTFLLLKKNVKISKERIPSATQLFTPDWIVRYMVENSLGRLWIEGHPDEDLKANWKYYLEEAEQEADVQAQLEEIRYEYKNLNPEDIKVIDPCMGSGHILVYCFDVLMQIYVSQGYTERDASRLIIENNLYGLDIDKRATQLAYFAVMMKARQYDRRIFTRNVKPHVFVIEESNSINRNHLQYFGATFSDENKHVAFNQMSNLLKTLIDAKDYGSILEIGNYNFKMINDFLEDNDKIEQISFETIGIEQTKERLKNIVEIAEVMACKYHVVITNPPYMGSSNMSINLTNYIKGNYPDSKADFSTVFIEKCIKYTKKNGFVSMVTPQSWMFLVAFKQLRDKVLNTLTISSLLQLGTGAFDGGFGTSAFAMRNNYICAEKANYYDLREGRDGTEKQEMFFAGKNHYLNSGEKLRKLPNCVIAYWCSDVLYRLFADEKQVRDDFSLECGIKNGNNNKFLRGWFEVSLDKTNASDERRICMRNMESGKKWFRCNKGGGYKKWYGNYEYVIDLENDAFNIKSTISPSTYRLRQKDNYFWPTITWPLSGGNRFGCRYMHTDVLPDVNANIIIIKSSKEYCLMGYMNSNVFDKTLDMLNPTLNFPIDTVASAPYILCDDISIENLVKRNVELAKADWDAYETSWDFSENPLVQICKNSEHKSSKKISVEDAFRRWEIICEERFVELKSNEEKLNQEFMKIYHLEDEMTYEVEDDNITVEKADLGKDVRRLISYAVGCMFGRYSLDNEGIVYAGGDWNIEAYRKYNVDVDNCIPITDEEYFEDDIVERFIDWLRVAFGEDNLEMNIEFVANALGSRGITAKEKIRTYFLNEFFKDHCMTYSVTGSGKLPIYWLFDSGKQNGFKCLVYMHRWNADTVGRIRSDYLRKCQEAIEAALKNAEYTIQNSTSAIDKATATKKRDKYIKQLSEIRAYFPALSHVALQRIDIDLDDGVKVNYEKFQNIEIIDENGKKQKINLLAKI